MPSQSSSFSSPPCLAPHLDLNFSLNTCFFEGSSSLSSQSSSLPESSPLFMKGSPLFSLSSQSSSSFLPPFDFPPCFLFILDFTFVITFSFFEGSSSLPSQSSSSCLPPFLASILDFNFSLITCFFEGSSSLSSQSSSSLESPLFMKGRPLFSLSSQSSSSFLPPFDFPPCFLFILDFTFAITFSFFEGSLSLPSQSSSSLESCFFMKGNPLLSKGAPVTLAKGSPVALKVTVWSMVLVEVVTVVRVTLLWSQSGTK